MASEYKEEMRRIINLMEQSVEDEIDDEAEEDTGDEGQEGGDKNARRMASVFLGDDSDTNVNTLAKIIQNHREGQPLEEMMNNRRYRQAVATAFEKTLDMVQQNQSIFNQMRRTGR